MEQRQKAGEALVSLGLAGIGHLPIATTEARLARALYFMETIKTPLSRRVGRRPNLLTDRGKGRGELAIRNGWGTCGSLEVTKGDALPLLHKGEGCGLFVVGWTN